MIYTRKKNPKILDFFCRKKWNFRGILLAKKKNGFFPIKKKKRFAENRKKMWKNFCRPPNVFWRQIRHQRLKYIRRHFFPPHNHDIRVKKWKNSGKFRIFFFECAEISAPRGQKTTFVEKIFKNYFAKLVGGYSLKVSNFPPSYKKSYFRWLFWVRFFDISCGFLTISCGFLTFLGEKIIIFFWPQYDPISLLNQCNMFI